MIFWSFATFFWFYHFLIRCQTKVLLYWIHVSLGPKWKNLGSGVPILVGSTASHPTYYNLPYYAGGNIFGIFQLLNSRCKKGNKVRQLILGQSKIMGHRKLWNGIWCSLSSTYAWNFADEEGFKGSEEHWQLQDLTINFGPIKKPSKLGIRTCFDKVRIKYIFVITLSLLSELVSVIIFSPRTNTNRGNGKNL